MFRPLDRRVARIIMGLTGLCLLCASASVAGTDVTVSQKGRKFNPLSVDVMRNGSLIIVNDDGDLLHHAYIESADFNFDSGDQKPGSRTRIVFPFTGDYRVLCGIHPKMKLMVHVH